MKLDLMKTVRSTAVVGLATALLISSNIYQNAETAFLSDNQISATESINMDDLNVNVSAGASSMLHDYSIASVSENDGSLVGSGVSEDVADDNSPICGYTNIAICQVEGNLNVRDAASLDGNILGKMTNNSACEVLGEEGDWTKISSGSIEEGYVLSEYLVKGTEARTIALAEKKLMATVTCDKLRVRSAPSTESDTIITVSEGEDIQVVSTDYDGWVQIQMDNDLGFVSAEFVEVGEKLKTAHTLKELYYGDGVSDVRVSLCNYAMQFLGNPYVWGGTSLTNGADCSGFTLSVFAHYGYYLPHYSGSQANCGVRIDPSEAKPGDLFFYGSGGYISHVAIYIGNGQIVHASTESTGIIVSNAYYRYPICVTRILN